MKNQPSRRTWLASIFGGLFASWVAGRNVGAQASFNIAEPVSSAALPGYDLWPYPLHSVMTFTYDQYAVPYLGEVTTTVYCVGRADDENRSRARPRPGTAERESG